MMNRSRNYIGPGFSPAVFAQHPWEEVIEGGRFNAVKLADLLGWSRADMAKFLGKSGAALSRQPLAAKDQDQRKLGSLVALLAMTLNLTSGNLDALKAWLVTPNWAFDNQSAKDLILENELEPIKNLIEEFEAGTVA